MDRYADRGLRQRTSPGRSPHSDLPDVDPCGRDSRAPGTLGASPSCGRGGGDGRGFALVRCWSLWHVGAGCSMSRVADSDIACANIVDVQSLRPIPAWQPSPDSRRSLARCPALSARLRKAGVRLLGATVGCVPIAVGYAFRSAIDDVLRWVGRFGEGNCHCRNWHILPSNGCNGSVARSCRWIGFPPTSSTALRKEGAAIRMFVSTKFNRLRDTSRARDLFRPIGLMKGSLAWHPQMRSLSIARAPTRRVRQQ